MDEYQVGDRVVQVSGANRGVVKWAGDSGPEPVVLVCWENDRLDLVRATAIRHDLDVAARDIARKVLEMAEVVDNRAADIGGGKAPLNLLIELTSMAEKYLERVGPIVRLEIDTQG